MSANRNSLPKSCTLLFKQPHAGPLGCSVARRQTTSRTRTDAQVSASRLPSSRLRRELRRWLHVPAKPAESQLRFAIPARIALPGEERASTVAIIRDPRTRPFRPVSTLACDRLPLPSARGERFRACLAGSNLPGLRIFPCRLSARASRYIISVHTHGNGRSCGTF